VCCFLTVDFGLHLRYGINCIYMISCSFCNNTFSVESVEFGLWFGLLLFFTPLVLLPDLLLFGRGKIILDVERTADLLWSFPLDHVGNRFAGDVQEAFNVQVVGSLDQSQINSLDT